MMRMSLLLTLGLFAGLAQAENLQAGDAARAKAKSGVCAACHGPDGNSANPEWPKLAGQHSQYIVAQLQAYKNGSRPNPIMAGQVAALTEQDMHDLGAFFAAQASKPGVANPDTAAAAEALYRGGRAADGITACSACHGPQGLGNAAAAYPRISGQHAPYSTAQLRAYRDNQRSGTASAQMMSKVAENLTDADIEALSSYLSGLH